MQPDETLGADSPDLEEGLDGGGSDATPAEVAKEIQPDEAQIKEDLEKKNEISTALKELDESDNESEKTIQAVDNAFRVSEALEDFYQELKEKTDPVTDKDKRLITMALESFGDLIGDSNETKIALEELDPISDDFLGSVITFAWDKVKKIWKIVIDMIKHMVIKLYDLITKIFALSRLIYGRARKLQLKAANTRTKPALEFVDSTDLIEDLHILGKPPANIVEDTTYLFYMAEGIYTEVSRWTSEMGETIANWLNTVNPTQATHAPLMPQVKIPYGETKEIVSPKEDVGGKIPFTRMLSTMPLLGGRVMMTRILDTTMKLSIEEAASIYPWLGSFIHHEYTDFTNNKSFKTLTAVDCNEIAKRVMDTAGYINGFEKQSRINNQIRKSILEGAKRIEEQLNELKETENRKTIEFAKNVALSAPRIVESPASQFAIYYLHMAGKLLDYVEASLDNHL